MVRGIVPYERLSIQPKVFLRFSVNVGQDEEQLYSKKVLRLDQVKESNCRGRKVAHPVSKVDEKLTTTR